MLSPFITGYIVYPGIIYLYISLLNPTNNLPHGRVRFHQPMRLHHVLPPKHFFREQFQPAVPQPGQRLLHHAVPQPALIRHVAAPQAASLKPDAFADELGERGARG